MLHHTCYRPTQKRKDSIINPASSNARHVPCDAKSDNVCGKTKAKPYCDFNCSASSVKIHGSPTSEEDTYAPPDQKMVKNISPPLSKTHTPTHNCHRPSPKKFSTTSAPHAPRIKSRHDTRIARHFASKPSLGTGVAYAPQPC